MHPSPEPDDDTFLIAWTTTARKDDAEALARTLLDAQCVACAQIDGPISSLYTWEGKLSSAQEYRLTLKFFKQHQPAVEAAIKRHHPYQTPQWIVVASHAVGESYHLWAKSVTKTT